MSAPLSGERPVLFVYGTLRADANHDMHTHVAAGGEHLGLARIRGRLLRVSWYPGLVPDASAEWVMGELWRLRDAAVFDELDRYEGCSPDDPAPHEYERREVTVEHLGQPLRAWTYVYCGPQDTCTAVESGDWLQGGPR